MMAAGAFRVSTVLIPGDVHPGTNIEFIKQT
jgi:hypothetical protein